MGGRQAVSGRYVVEGADRVAFSLGTYDRRQPLVIDPVLSYSTYLGGSGPTWGNAITLDGAGNAYVVGYTRSPYFPTTPGAFQTTYEGRSDAFVAELNPTGTALVYSTYLGGTADNAITGIAVDSTGSAYVTGYT
jgi:hypothetical protein